MDRRRPADDLLVAAMAPDDVDPDGDRLVGLVGDDGAELDLLRPGDAVGGRRALAGLSALAALRGADAAPLGRLGGTLGRALGGAVLGRALRLGFAGVKRALTLAQLLGAQRLLGLGRAHRRPAPRGSARGSLLGAHRGQPPPPGLSASGVRASGASASGVSARRCLVLLFLGHQLRVLSSLSMSIPRSRATVRSRARSRFEAPIPAVFSSSPVAWRKRRLNASSRAFLSASTRSWSRQGVCVGGLHCRALAPHELGLDRQLVAGQAHRLLGEVLRHARELEHHAPRLDDGDPALGVALARAHAGLGGLLRERLVGEDVDPDLAAALDLAGHRNTRSLDLAVGDPAALERLQAVLAEVQVRAALGVATALPAHHLAVLDTLRAQHLKMHLHAVARAFGRRTVGCGRRRGGRLGRWSRGFAGGLGGLLRWRRSGGWRRRRRLAAAFAAAVRGAGAPCGGSAGRSSSSSWSAPAR